MQRLSSYVPELTHFQRKHTTPSRLFFEDLAVLEGATGRILASRGEAFSGEEGAARRWLMQGGEKESASSFLWGAPRCLYAAGEGSVLLFADLLPLTGLLIAAYLPYATDRVAFFLRRLGRGEFHLSRELPLGNPAALGAAEEEPHLERLQELLFYLDRALCAKESASLWTDCVTLSHLAGCRLEQVSMPPTLPKMRPASLARLHLFLLCSFLAFREREGRVLAETKEDPDRGICQCRISFSPCRVAGGGMLDDEASEKALAEFPELPFLGTDCFAGFSLFRGDEDGTLCADLPIEPLSAALRAQTSVCRIRLRIAPRGA